MKNKKVAFLTLGCKTNQYETNGMAQKFSEEGYTICEMNEKPDIAIINTCTVTNISDRKSRQHLRHVKEKNKDAIVVACGCYAQVAKDKLEEMEEIDLVLGNKEKKDIVKYVEDFISEVSDISKQKEFDEFGSITYTEKTRATIKIQDGCNNFCTYCLIPYARGRIRSRKKENIIKEVTEIAKTGIKEIVLTGIHIASYGKDLNNEYMLIDLLEDLNKIEGIQRIRLGSLEPTIITDKFVKRLVKLEKICDQFHLSLQSGCNETLKRMNRKYTTEEFKEVVGRLRQNFEDVNLTTDIIVGFPGETEEEFNKTYEFLKEIAFYKMHVFKYSKRDGTPAATMQNQVDGKIQEERSKKVIELSNKNQLKYNQKYIGKELEVLFEEKQGDFYVGHTKNYIVVKTASYESLDNKIITVVGKEVDGEEIIGKI
ncbi:MAG: tRNA (N(6)-L-threonylcarbamoyladenosine(37)-C(2))-methylthiotransferase MtaB [Clostridia bacterium]|nr:tRNA (N(6)-L-threonylcarbamoyladenosine(37)-C(2))-methylthiotransferase MtaB [Clostridia bacterium]